MLSLVAHAQPTSFSVEEFASSNIRTITQKARLFVVRKWPDENAEPCEASFALGGRRLFGKAGVALRFSFFDIIRVQPDELDQEFGSLRRPD
jgi:hypothetical protein